MPRDSDSLSRRRDKYSQRTHRPLNSLLFILAPLLFFQIGAAYYGTGLFAPRDLGRLLRYFGATAPYLPPVLIVVVLLVQHAARGDRTKLQPKVLVGMFGESILWAVPLVAMYYLGRMALAASTQSQGRILQELLTDVGAGIYEEFIFRLAFISLVMLILVDIFELRKNVVLILSVLVSAVLFSLYHFSGAQLFGDLAFPWHEFLFRAAAGVYLGALFIFRGFGVVVGAHIAYNIYAAASSP